LTPEISSSPLSHIPISAAISHLLSSLISISAAISHPSPSHTIRRGYTPRRHTIREGNPPPYMAAVRDVTQYVTAVRDVTPRISCGARNTLRSARQIQKTSVRLHDPTLAFP